MRNRQVAPDWSTGILEALVPRISYKPSWRFALIEDRDRGQGCAGLTLSISGEAPDSSGNGKTTHFDHSMPVLPAAYDEENWTRWILEQVEMVERHEMLEFFKVAGEPPYFPAHGPGQNPYAVRLITTRERAHAEPLPWTGEQTHGGFE